MVISYLFTGNEFKKPEIDRCSPPIGKGNTSDGKERNTSKECGNSKYIHECKPALYLG
jgi:hypothetical protein